MKHTFKKVEATTEEIIKRMVDGEVFYSESGSVGYCYDQASKQFEWRENQGAHDLSGFNFPLYERIEQPWYEDEEFKLPCLMVSNVYHGLIYVMIEHHCGDRFYSDNNNVPHLDSDLTPVPRDENGNYIINEERK